jgi:NAD(P)H-dependent FMN reductase
MESPLHVAVITGSTREGRYGPNVTRWVLTQAQPRPDMVLDGIDLAGLDLPAVYPQRLDHATQEFVDRIDRADGYVVVTPEYNHGYPAGLKQAIDLARFQWQAKPVAFVSYGGFAGGLRAVEQLRQVFAELHAVTVRDTVSFHNYPELFDDVGELRDQQGPNAAAKVLLDRLAWWGRALRSARASTPYDS